MTSPGAMARGLLGERYTQVVGRAYRALFADLKRAAAIVSQAIPQNARVLDVGGGDGEHLNCLLDLRSDIRVTTIDVAAQVGGWIRECHAARVERRPATTLVHHVREAQTLPDVVLICDVVHHIPQADRADFFATVAKLLERSPRTRVIVKDVQPGYLRATLGYLSDRFVSGDIGVSPISRDELIATMQRACHDIHCEETPLFEADCPNYALVFFRQAEPMRTSG